jgi:Mg2+/Co2+ transporter CorC
MQIGTVRTIVLHAEERFPQSGELVDVGGITFSVFKAEKRLSDSRIVVTLIGGPT